MKTVHQCHSEDLDGSSYLCFCFISIGIPEQPVSLRTLPESGVSTCPNDRTAAWMSSKERGCLHSHHVDLMYWFWSASHTKQELEAVVDCLPTLLSGASCGLWDFKLHLIFEMYDSPLSLSLSVSVKFLSLHVRRFRDKIRISLLRGLGVIKPLAIILPLYGAILKFCALWRYSWDHPPAQRPLCPGEFYWLPELTFN